MLLYKSRGVVYNRTYHYPAIAAILGWAAGLGIALIIPCYALYLFSQQKGSFLQVKVDGWVGGWVGGWTMDRWMDGQVNRWMDG